MGLKSSKLKVYSKLCLTQECETIDCISLSYVSGSGCGRDCSGKQKQVVIASFCYDRAEGLNDLGVRRFSSTKSTSVNVKKLRKKEGNIPVKVSCLAEGVPVLETELELSNLLHGLQLAKRGGRSALMFGVSPRRNKLDGQKSYKLFCNGQLIVDPGEGSAHHQDTVVNTQQHNNEVKETLQENVTPVEKSDPGSKVTPVENSDPGGKLTSIERFDPEIMKVPKPIEKSDHESPDVTPPRSDCDNDSVVTSNQRHDDDDDRAAMITPDNDVKEMPNMFTSHDHHKNSDNVTTVTTVNNEGTEINRDSPYCYHEHKEEDNKEDTRDSSSSFSFSFTELDKDFGIEKKVRNGGDERPRNVPQDINTPPHTPSSETETETETETESGSEFSDVPLDDDNDGDSPAVLPVMPPVEWTFSSSMKVATNPLDEYVTGVIQTYKNPMEEITEEEALRLMQKQTPETPSTTTKRHNKKRNNYKFKIKILLGFAVKFIPPVILCLSAYNAWIEYSDYMKHRDWHFTEL